MATTEPSPSVRGTLPLPIVRKEHHSKQDMPVMYTFAAILSRACTTGLALCPIREKASFTTGLAVCSIRGKASFAYLRPGDHPVLPVGDGLVSGRGSSS